jgi:adenosine deaminase
MVELHCHLDGCVRLSTLTELLIEKNLELPTNIKFYPGMGIDEALSRFKTTLSVLQEPDAVARVSEEICLDAMAFGHSFTEIRFAPQLHQGAPIEKIVDAAISGLSEHSSIILCGLYGEPPDVLNTLVEMARGKPRIVGIDLAGAPLPTHHWSLMDYIEPFEKAKRYGIGRTVHAGEGRSPNEIEVAINFLHAQRIGHGTTLMESRKVLDLVREREVTIEACITSNWHTGAIDALSKHPIKKWIDEDVRVAICADNTLLSDTILPMEYRRAVAHCGLSYQDTMKCKQYAIEALFRR